MLELTDENFEKEISNAKKPVLVDFFAIWCPPCSILSPILEKIEEEFKEKVIFAKVNVDAAPKTSQKYGINPIPTVILFKGGKPISEFIGARPENEIREWLKDNLENEKDGVKKIIQEVEEDKSSSPPSLSLREISVYEEYAKKNGFRLNPNRKMVERVVKSLLEREKNLVFGIVHVEELPGTRRKIKKLFVPVLIIA